MESLKPMKLQTKLLMSILILTIIAVSTSGYFISDFEVDQLEEKTRQNLENIASLISNSSVIELALANRNVVKIQNIIEEDLSDLKDIENIAILDNEGMYLGYTDRKYIGKFFCDSYENCFLKDKSKYSTIFIENINQSIRVFVPVFYKEEQVGIIVVANKYDRIKYAIRNIRFSILIYSFFGILIGGIGAIWISISIKKSLLYLEPHEITKSYLEKDVILKSIKEGIIAIDLDGNINLMNESANKILNCQNKNFIGRNILEIFPSTQLIKVMETRKAECDRDEIINGARVLTNKIPIYKNDMVIGAIATFKDLSDVFILAEEITGFKQIVDALRAINHEFMNKLHLIQGLIELGEYDKTKEYIRGLGRRYTKVQYLISDKIKNPIINALIIGKINIASEEKIRVEVTNDSLFLCEEYNLNVGAMVIIVGNLIENAIEAVKNSKRKNGLVSIYLNDVFDSIVIEVTDNGVGIKEEDVKNIFKRGYSTKEGSNGIGLDLVKATVERYHGEITVSSEYDKETVFTVIMPIE